MVLVLGVGRCAFRPPRVVFVLGLVSLIISLTSGKKNLCHPRSRSLPLPLCGACPFVGYCGFCFSINYFRKRGVVVMSLSSPFETHNTP